ncbi:MAG: EamA family transporter [Crocinitomicaceae bacterium]|nr:EamA family transporter [Crocinitomicaceae bacterium]
MLFPILIITKKKNVFFDKQAIKFGLITGIILGGIYVIQTLGMQFTSSNHSAFITSSAVIMVPLLLVLTGKQQLNFTQIACILLIALGLYLLTNSNDNQPYNLGDTITFFGAIVCALHIILSGHFVRKTEFLGLIFYQFLFAMIISFFGLLISKGINPSEINFSPLVINNVLYLGFFGTLLCFFITIWAQKFVSTITTAMIFSLEPVFAATTSFILLHESLTLIEILGGIVILLGLIAFNFLDSKSGVASNNHQSIN